MEVTEQPVQRSLCSNAEAPGWRRHIGRVSARSPGPRLSLSVTLSIGIVPRPTLDSAPVGLICRRPMGRWSRFLPRPHPVAARAHHAGTYARNAAEEEVS